jgi:hypothetical protein
MILGSVRMTNAPVTTVRQRPTLLATRTATTVRRYPATFVLSALLLVAGVASGGFVSPISSEPWYTTLAYGVPALQAGAWWTPLTGTFLVMQPAGYLVMLLLVPAGIGWLEHQRGTRVAAAWFVGGQLFALAATFLFLAIAAPAGSVWAADLLTEYDVGPSGGLFACLAAAVCTLPLPWRNSHYIGPSRNSVIAYQVHSGVAIALSDPIAPPSEKREALAAWAEASEKAGLVPSVFGASDFCRRHMPPTWRALQIAEDTIVTLPGLTFTGKRWNTVRTALNRAAREGITFRLTTLSSEPKTVRRQLDAISEQWVGDKGLPEMRFTLGSIDEALDPEVRLALAETADGRVDGFLSWLPIYGGDGRMTGWTLDLMRRRDGGFPPVMEFLIASSAEAFRDEGAQILSLSGAPLAHSEPSEAGVIEKLLDQIGAALEPVYGFRSLHRFKQKFNPSAQPLYLLFPHEGDLPAIALAITRAYLPDASLVDLMRAGLIKVRGTRSRT